MRAYSTFRLHSEFRTREHEAAAAAAAAAKKESSYVFVVRFYQVQSEKCQSGAAMIINPTALIVLL